MKSTIMLFWIGIFISTTGYAQNMNFEDWDKDANKRITHSEFNSIFTKLYWDDANEQDDNILDDDDFYDIVFSFWDHNNDSLITEQEWMTRYEYNYTDYIDKDFDDIDKDNNTYIDYSEYDSVIYKTKFYEEMDVNKDEFMDELELSRAIFNLWDLDNSNFIEPDEYVKFDAYYIEF